MYIIVVVVDDDDDIIDVHNKYSHILESYREIAQFLIKLI